MIGADHLRRVQVKHLIHERNTGNFRVFLHKLDIKRKFI